MNTAPARQWSSAIKALYPRQMGALPLIYPILSDLHVRQTVNELVPTEADIDLGCIVVLLPQSPVGAAAAVSGPGLAGRDGTAGGVGHPTRAGLRQSAGAGAGPALSPPGRAVGQACQSGRPGLRPGPECPPLGHHLHLLRGGLYRQRIGHLWLQPGSSPGHELDVSHDGYVPVWYQVLPGNTADITRPLPHLRALLHFLSRPELAERRLRPILVSDCKMVTPEAALACHRHDLFYLGPLPNGTATEQVLRSVSAQELAAHPLAYRPQRVKADDLNFVPYQGVWRPFTFEHDGQRVTDRALVVWSAGKQRLDEQKRKTYLKRLLNSLEAIQKKLNSRRYKQRGYVEQRLAKVQEGNPARGLVDVELRGEDDHLRLIFRINRQRLAAAQALLVARKG